MIPIETFGSKSRANTASRYRQTSLTRERCAQVWRARAGTKRKGKGWWSWLNVKCCNSGSAFIYRQYVVCESNSRSYERLWLLNHCRNCAESIRKITSPSPLPHRSGGLRDKREAKVARRQTSAQHRVSAPGFALRPCGHICLCRGICG